MIGWEELLPLVPVVVTAATWAVLARAPRRLEGRVRQRWVDHGVSLGLEEADPPGGHGRGLVGRYGDTRLHAEWRASEGPGTPGAGRVVIQSRLCDALGLSSADPRQPARRRAPAPVATGDAELDRVFAWAGPEALVRALLDGPTRDALRRLAATCAWSRQPGGWAFSPRGELLSVHPASVLALAVTLAQRLERVSRAKADCALNAEVARIAHEDVVPGVRAGAMGWLAAQAQAGEGGPAEMLREALVAGLEDPAPAVRVAAACGLEGASAEDALRAVVEADDVVPWVRLDALEALEARWSVERWTVLAQPFLEALAEPFLLAELHVDDPERQAEAARRLGRYGSPRAIEALVALTRGLFGRGVVGRVAEEAVVAIRARSGAGPGQLALAGPNGPPGGLSTSTPLGAVSPPRVAGQRPLAAPASPGRREE